MNPKTIWGKEPAALIGLAAALVLAVVHTLAGEGVIGTDVADTIAKAIDPRQAGWALPFIVNLVTRFAVYAPATVDTIAAQAAATGNPVVQVGPP